VPHPVDFFLSTGWEATNPLTQTVPFPSRLIHNSVILSGVDRASDRRSGGICPENSCGRRCDCYLKSKVLKPADVESNQVRGAYAVEKLWAEVAILGAFLEHVVNNGEQ
jgi:hypothetical protein